MCPHPSPLRARFAALGLPLIGAVLLLAGCASRPDNPVRELTVLSFNDFHGNIQAQGPVPISPRVADPATGELRAEPGGGVAHFATALQGLRAKARHSLVVAGGDLIGATPQISALLRDEPTLAAMGQLGVVASALGNHELDAGLPELLRQARGECKPAGCLWPGFKGPGFPYLAANLLDAKTGQPLLPTHRILEVGGLKIGIAGVVTRDTPKVVVARAIEGLRFGDEVETLNALVPTLRAQGAQLLIAVMHEGAVQTASGASTSDPTYACPSLSGRGVEIAKGLDPAYGLIVGGHTHQAYTCKVNGRLVVQAGSYGGWITESRLTLDANARVIAAEALNHPVVQSRFAPNAELAALVARAAELTAATRLKPIATLPASASRRVEAPNGDSVLGNLIADGQLAYARKFGPADMAFMNPGGIRADLTVQPGKPVTLSDLLAVQPFGNELVVLTMSGQQLLDLLQRQLPKGDAPPRILAQSGNLRWTWRQREGVSLLGEVLLDGKPLDPARDYRVVVNNFLSEGGDAHVGFRHGRDRAVVGGDIDAMIEHLQTQPAALSQAVVGRVLKAAP